LNVVLTFFVTDKVVLEFKLHLHNCLVI